VLDVEVSVKTDPRAVMAVACTNQVVTPSLKVISKWDQKFL
jgi:hypothetical protein